MKKSVTEQYQAKQGSSAVFRRTIQSFFDVANKQIDCITRVDEKILLQNRRTLTVTQKPAGKIDELFVPGKHQITIFASTNKRLRIRFKIKI